jgi:pyruvate formate lyase activating enzyme
MKKALLFKKFPKKIVQCLTCQRYCRIAPGQTGFCLTKINKNGVLYALNYGVLNHFPSPDPIEKKPFYHFLPGTRTFSIGSFGCNYRCKQCLNWWCSWGEPATTILKKLAAGKREKRFVKTQPQELIDLCLQSDLKSIAFTYNEPTIWLEYALDIAKLAKKRGLKTLFVTNGSWSKEALEMIGPYLDAANIDFKGFSQKTYAKMGAFWGQLLENTKLAQKKHQIFIELTTVLIPGINDSPSELKKMAVWIVKNLGPKTPWHLSRYSPGMAPDKNFAKIPPTSREQLLRAEKIGKKAGLHFVYIWAPGVDLNGGVFAKGDTHCPQCKILAVRRDLWQPKILAVDKKGKCKKCGEDLNLKLETRD